MRRLLRIAAVLSLVVLLGISRIGQAVAKTPGYVVTGGDLGSYAALVFIDHYVDYPNDDAREVSPPAQQPAGKAYMLYGSWPFQTAGQVVEAKPAAIYYPWSSLSFVAALGQWLQLSKGAKEDLDGAIEKVRVAMPADATQSPVLAAIETYFGDASFFVTAGAEPGFRLDVGAFPFEALAEALSRPPMERPLTEQARSWLKVYASPRNAGPIVLMYCAPPQDGVAGEIWAPDPADQRRWLAGPPFDDAFAAAPKQPLMPTLVENLELTGQGNRPVVATPVTGDGLSPNAGQSGAEEPKPRTIWGRGPLALPLVAAGGALICVGLGLGLRRRAVRLKQR